MYQLRPYQKSYISKLNNSAVSPAKSALLIAYTGAGKTDIACEFMRQKVGQGKKIAFVVHTKELVDNAHARLMKYGIKAGYIKAGYPADSEKPVQVCSIQTLRNRELPEVDFLIIDEAHHAKAATYQNLIESYPNAVKIGLTATPFRGNGEGLGDIFQDFIHEVTAAELIAKGFIVPSRIFVPTNENERANMKGVSKSGNDYNVREMSNRFSKIEIFDSVVRNFKELAKDRKAICYNCSVEHSKKTCRLFNKHGIKSAHIDAKTPQDERERIIKRFEDGKIQVLHNVNIFTEGYDCPEASCIVLNRATASLPLYIQMTGRGARVDGNGKTDNMILDFGANAMKFGFPESYDQGGFDKDGKIKDKTDGEAPVKQCPECGWLSPAAVAECDNCGFDFANKNDEKGTYSNIEMEEIINANLTQAKDLFVKLSKTYKTIEVISSCSDSEINHLIYTQKGVLLKVTTFVKHPDMTLLLLNPENLNYLPPVILKEEYQLTQIGSDGEVSTNKVEIKADEGTTINDVSTKKTFAQKPSAAGFFTHIDRLSGKKKMLNISEVRRNLSANRSRLRKATTEEAISNITQIVKYWESAENFLVSGGDSATTILNAGMSQCEYCGEAYVHSHSKQKYCSTNCRVSAFNVRKHSGK